jgi:hypothetical protein
MLGTGMTQVRVIDAAEEDAFGSKQTGALNLAMRGPARRPVRGGCADLPRSP